MPEPGSRQGGWPEMAAGASCEAPDCTRPVFVIWDFDGQGAVRLCYDCADAIEMDDDKPKGVLSGY